MSHKSTPPTKSDNPRYYSTGKKLDIKKGVEQYQPGWMPKDEYWKMRKQERALREGVKPTSQDLALLHTLHAETDNAVVAAIWQWYDNHGCVKLSQLTYLRGLAAQLYTASA